jgi:hypothetical protein
MSSTLWKVRAIKQWAAVTKGMEVDIVVQNRTGKPFIRDIAQALTKKYGIKDLSGSGLPETTFEFYKT